MFGIMPALLWPSVRPPWGLLPDCDSDNRFQYHYKEPLLKRVGPVLLWNSGPIVDANAEIAAVQVLLREPIKGDRATVGQGQNDPGV